MSPLNQMRIKPLFRALFVAIVTLLSAHCVIAKANTQLTVQAQAPERYVVKEGDTLWHISRLYLDDPWLWPMLWQRNQDIVNPNLIYPGDTLILTWHQGEPHLRLQPRIKLSPKVRHKVKPNPIIANALPELLSQRAARLLDESALQSAAQVLATPSGRHYLTKETPLRIAGEHSEMWWGIYRHLSQYSRSEFQAAVHGLQQVAVAQRIQSAAEMTTLAIQSQHQEVRVGDIALPLLPSAVPAKPLAFYSGNIEILGNLEDTQYSQPNQWVVLSKGAYDGVSVGQVFAVYHKLDWPDLDAKSQPHLEVTVTESQPIIGTIRVIESHAYFSLAQVVTGEWPLTQGMPVAALDLPARDARSQSPSLSHLPIR
ncbi:LysM peptidoglycan-binding domain-containing protein [Vibrio sp. SM6]|uniref:LysM peptidoglycan-binding domain-containing protein n=1 Tax=Vibrio agarilyticus TaxID=2726741 RepID=A0A7X8YI56_9VIBR|nr:LysM peptidoglycan-binding domain-containing protein [Vibrio agarilyticus]NLS14364.1 LysM peptidoglycan-binding domain-containing protein [Vibrio agarilyticus]